MFSNRALSLAVAVLALLCLHPQANATTIPLAGAGGSHTAQACTIAQDGNASRLNPASGQALNFTGVGATAGDTQIAIMWTTTASATWTKPSNFTQQVNSSTGAGTTTIFTATSSLSATPTFTASGGTVGGTVAAYTNTNGSLDGTPTLTVTANSATSNATAVTPTLAHDALAFLAMNNSQSGNANVTTPPSGYTEDAVTGGASGSQYAERDYFLVNPALSSQQPALVWSYSATGNVAVGAYFLLEAAIAC